MGNIKKFILCSSLICVLFLSSLSNVLAYDSTRGLAYSIGTKYTDIDTSIDALNGESTFKTLGFNSFANTAPTYKILRGYHTLANRFFLESKILLFSGHGNWNNMTFNYNGYGGDYATGVYIGRNGYVDIYQYAGLESYDMNKVALMIFAGCKTTDPSASTNLAKHANELGARTTMGWTTEIAPTSHTQWLKNFFSKLTKSSSIKVAVDYANGFAYVDNRVKNVVVYGDTLYTPAWDNGASTLNLLKIPQNLINVMEQENLHNTSIKLNSNYTSEDVDTLVENYIKNNIDEQFELDNYTREISGVDNQYYDYKLLVNGAISDSAYTVVIDNNTITSVIDNTKEINLASASLYGTNNIQSSNIANSIKSDLLEQNPSYEILNQEIKEVYISEDGVIRTYIFTEVYDTGANNYFVHEKVLN